MTESIKINHVDEWNFLYKGILIKVKRHVTNYDNKEHWCYYLTWCKHKINHAVFNLMTAGIKETKYLSCNYDDSPLSRLGWHVGCTFGKLTRDENAELQYIELGCDYSHIWDEGKTYDLEELISDAKNTADDFISQYPNYLAIKVDLWD